MEVQWAVGMSQKSFGMAELFKQWFSDFSYRAKVYATLPLAERHHLKDKVMFSRHFDVIWLTELSKHLLSIY